MIKVFLIIAVIIQTVATVYALQLVRATKYNAVWILFIIGFSLLSVERLVQLAHGPAKLREHVACEGDGRIAAVHDVGERLAPNELHDHDAPGAHRMAVEHQGQVEEPPARALGAPEPLVSRPEARVAVKVLAHVRPLLRAVRPHEVHELRGLERALLHDGVHAVAAVARQCIEMFRKLVHDRYMVAEGAGGAPDAGAVRAGSSQPQQIVSSPKR